MKPFTHVCLIGLSCALVAACQSGSQSTDQSSRAATAVSAGVPANKEEKLEKFVQHESEFKRHFETHYADSGYGYHQYRPAYQYGYELAINPSYKKMNWDSIESHAREGWNESTMGFWHRYKGAIQYGWERGLISERG